jgi:hypothetical protein
MNLKIYLFRAVVAVAAFAFGVSLFSFGQYLKGLFQIKKQEVAAIRFENTQENAAVTPVAKQETLIMPPVAAQTETTIVDSEENNKYEFDATGDYYIVGDLTKGFEDFEEMSIITKDYSTESLEYTNGIPIPPEGYVLAKKKYKFSRINIANKEIAFETETKKGISYKFVGGFFDDTDEDFAILKGRLTKMRDGKKIAESKVRFLTGGC